MANRIGIIFKYEYYNYIGGKMKGVILGSYIFIVALLIGTIVFSGCVSDNKPDVIDDLNFNQSAFDKLVQGNNEFGFKLYSELSKTDNQFFSPYSITSAFGVLGEASNGNTKKELDNLFGFPSLELRKASFAHFYNIINNNSSEYKLNTANALWVKKDFVLLPEYVDNAEKYYGAKLENIDFSDAEKSSGIINKWVEDQTNNRIKNLIPASAINDYTRLIITNAIYFKGKWLNAFDKDNTEEKDFTNDSGVKSKANYMEIYDDPFYYYEDSELQAIKLYYKGNDLSAIVILPKTNLESLKDLDNTKFNTILNAMSDEQVDLYLPKFKLETNYSLVDALGKLGLKEVFTERADLSGFTGERNLYVTGVVHKAFVEVNEEGTEAAAATGIIVGKSTAMPIEEPEPKVFNANHPFMFFIIDNNTKNILFFGSIVDPKE